MDQTLRTLERAIDPEGQRKLQAARRRVCPYSRESVKLALDMLAALNENDTVSGGPIGVFWRSRGKTVRPVLQYDGRNFAFRVLEFGEPVAPEVGAHFYRQRPLAWWDDYIFWSESRTQRSRANVAKHGTVAVENRLYIWAKRRAVFKGFYGL